MEMTPAAAVLGTVLAMAAAPLAAQPLRPAAGLDTGLAVEATPASQRRPIPPWVFGRGGEPRLVPPRSIPAGRAGHAVGAQQAPLPRSRPPVPDGTTATATGQRPMPPRAPGAIDVPVAPLN
jgi:hypothetical protein